MKYKIAQNDKRQKIIEVHISKEVVDEEIGKIYQELSKSVLLPGFRQGKAPLELVKKRYQKEAEQEAARKIVADSFGRAVKESSIRVLGLPEISALQFGGNEGMSYKATVNARPDVKIKSYKALALKRIDSEIKESDIDSYLGSIREMHATYKAKEGAAAMGDYLICDMDCFVDGNFVERKENAWLCADKDAYIPQDALEGMRVSDEKDVEKELPAGYSKKEFAGKKAKFHIKVKEVKEKVLPELNDEFAAKAGNFRNTAELREALREQLRRRGKIKERRDLERQALALLDKCAVFDVPQPIIDKHLKRLLEEASERLAGEGYSAGDIEAKKDYLTEKLREDALRQVRAYFILDEIADLEGINVGAADLKAAFGEMAEASGSSAEEVKKYYEKNGLIDDLTADIRQKKALDIVIENAAIS